MALEKLASKRDLPLSPGKKPFLSEYVESSGLDVVGNNYEILEVKETASRAGYLVETKAFLVVLFKSNPQCEQILELVEDAYSSSFCALYVVIDEDEPSGISFARDKAVGRNWVRTKKFPGGYRFTVQGGSAKKTKPPRDLNPGS